MSEPRKPMYVERSRQDRRLLRLIKRGKVRKVTPTSIRGEKIAELAKERP